MGVWITNMIIPVLLVVCGVWLFMCPPKEINSIFGYRTAMSKTNKDTWLFAQKYSGKLMFIIGAILSLLSIVVILLLLDTETGTLRVLGSYLPIAHLIFIMIPIALTEKALSKNFDISGNRK